MVFSFFFFLLACLLFLNWYKPFQQFHNRFDKNIEGDCCYQSGCFGRLSRHKITTKLGLLTQQFDDFIPTRLLLFWCHIQCKIYLSWLIANILNLIDIGLFLIVKILLDRLVNLAIHEFADRSDPGIQNCFTWVRTYVLESSTYVFKKY